MVDPKSIPVFAAALSQGQADPKDVALLEKIIEKTTSNKVYWNRTKDGYSAESPGLNLEFKGSRNSWYSFAVRTKEGIVLDVENKSSVVLAILSGMKVDEIVRLTDRLFTLVEKVGEGKVKRAIDLIDKL